MLQLRSFMDKEGCHIDEIRFSNSVFPANMLFGAFLGQLSFGNWHYT